LRQIIEKVTEVRRPVIVNFIDFHKTFDSIHLPALWKVLQHYGLPTKSYSHSEALRGDSGE